MADYSKINSLDELTYEEQKQLPWWKNIRNLWNTGADYILVYGGRSNGKSFSVLRLLLEEYRDHGKKFIYLRRWDEDVNTYACSSLIKQDLVDDVFGPEYYIKTRNHILYLCHTETDEKGKEIEKKEEIAYALAISKAKNYKGMNFSSIGTIFFDEFIDMVGERILTNEYNKFENIISTVKRANSIRIIMCANTVSKYSEYFTKLGINPDHIEQGETKHFLHQNGKYKVAVEYTITDPLIQRLVGNMTDSSMITEGIWEIPPTDEIPSEENEKITEQLLCTMYEPSLDATIAIFDHYGTWVSYETNKMKLLDTVEHEREFLVIRRVENGRKSSYFHLTNQKGLGQNYYHSLDRMLADILNDTDIDVKRELMLGRVFCDNMHTGDLFNQVWQKYSNVKIRELL